MLSKRVYVFLNGSVLGHPGATVNVTHGMTVRDFLLEASNALSHPSHAVFVEATQTMIEQTCSNLYSRVQEDSVLLVDADRRATFKPRVDLGKPPKASFWENCAIL